MEADPTPDLQIPIATDMGPSEKATPAWSTHDRACTHCREKKIRCGRERPQCANCKRDGVDCGYFSPDKRVNHIKLLCNNVGGLEDRLNNIEGELSSLTTLLKMAGNQGPFIDTVTEKGSLMPFSVDDQPTEDIPSTTLTDRHIVRSQEDLVDRYHGPGSLFALCNEFSSTTLSERAGQSPYSGKDDSEQGKKQDRPARVELIKPLLTHICLEASTEALFNFQSDHVLTRLPPKQFLSMVQTQFFQQVDYATDIFVQSSFASNVERVYLRDLTPADEAWAICFNTIILLVLGPEISTQGNDPLAGSQFTQPFLLTVRKALSNPHIMMAPVLINVQALAFLSIAAQQYYPPGFAASIFAQACVLARTMGLHQTHAASDGIAPAEAQERFKVFRSLYLQDKKFLISRGSICWLASFDCSLSLELGRLALANSNCAARIQLARLQEEIYRLYSAEPQKQASGTHKSALSRIEQNLERWLDCHDIFSPPWTIAADVVDLRLEYLGARIAAFRGSSDPSHIRRTLNDARASCIMLIISYGKYDPSMAERLEALTLSKSSLRSLAKSANSRLSKSKTSSNEFLNTREDNLTKVVPFGFHSVLDTFPVPAFFVLVKNAVRLLSASGEPEEEDIQILQRVCACYKEFDARTQANNRIRKVGRVFERLLELVTLVESSSHQSSHPDSQPSTQNLSSGQQDLSDCSELPARSSYPMPSMSQDGFSKRNPPIRTIDSATNGVSLGLPTPMETVYFDQQHAFSPQFPQQLPSTPSRKRSRLGEAEVSIDDWTESTLLSDFLTSSDMMSF